MFPPFTDRDNEAQISEVMCPRLHINWKSQEPKLHVSDVEVQSAGPHHLPIKKADEHFKAGEIQAEFNKHLQSSHLISRPHGHHFTDGETEAQKGDVTHPWSCRHYVEDL